VQQGVPFTTYVAHTITSQSQRSELVTPPSMFPGLPPRTSQIMAAEPLSLSTYPSVRSSRRWLWIALVALVVTGGGIAADVMLSGSTKQPANDVQMTSTPAEPVVKPPEVAPPAVKPPEPTVPVPEPTVPEPTIAAKPPEEHKPAAAKPPVRHVVKPPAPTTTKPKPKPPETHKPDQEPTWDPNSPFLPQ
jgi:hypothetical protein